MNLKKIFSFKVCMIIIIALLIIVAGLTWGLLTKKGANNEDTYAQELVDRIEFDQNAFEMDALATSTEHFGCEIMVKKYFDSLTGNDVQKFSKLNSYKINSCELYTDENHPVASNIFYLTVNFDIMIDSPTDSIFIPDVDGTGTDQGEGNITGKTYTFAVEYNDMVRDGKLRADSYIINIGNINY